eukprot:3933524-Rhodomonas_salina.2
MVRERQSVCFCVCVCDRGQCFPQVGTHFLRAHNSRFSPAPSCSSTHFTALASEEGLASLNTHQWAREKLLFQPALL